MKQELKDRDKAHELYLRVKSEVGRCLAYLKEKRENDPYRNLLSRLIYQATHSFTSEIPTFKLWIFSEYEMNNIYREWRDIIEEVAQGVFTKPHKPHKLQKPHQNRLQNDITAPHRK